MGGVGKGERKDRDPRCSWATLGLLDLRERERARRGMVSVGGPVVLVGGAWSVGRLVGGGRSVGRWRCTVERGRFGKWPELQ
jgi:hypothetical protein